jgi:hypothetical protein
MREGASDVRHAAGAFASIPPLPPTREREAAAQPFLFEMVARQASNRARPMLSSMTQRA